MFLSPLRIYSSYKYLKLFKKTIFHIVIYNKIICLSMKILIVLVMVSCFFGVSLYLTIMKNKYAKLFPEYDGRKKRE